MPRSKPWRMLYGTSEKVFKRPSDRSSHSQASAMKGVTMMRKLEYGGAGLGVVHFVAAKRAGVFSSALVEGAVTVFSVPTKAVLATVAIGARDVWGSGFWE